MIRKRTPLPVPKIASVEPLQVLPATLTEYLRESKGRGLRDLYIQIPLVPPKYGLVAVSIDELIKLAEREESPSGNVAKSASPVHPKPAKKLKLKRG